MITLRRIRIAAAVALALSTALPMYTCPGFVTSDGTTVSQIPADADSSAYQPTRVPVYPLESFNARDWVNWVTVLIYAWPLLLLTIPRVRARYPRIISVVELLLALFTGWYVMATASLGRIASGGILSIAAGGTLASIAIVEGVRAFEHAKRDGVRQSTPPDRLQDAAAT